MAGKLGNKILEEVKVVPLSTEVTLRRVVEVAPAIPEIGRFEETEMWECWWGLFQ